MIKLLLIGIIYIFHSHSCEDEHGNRRIHQFFVQTIAPDVIADAVLKGVIPTHQGQDKSFGPDADDFLADHYNKANMEINNLPSSSKWIGQMFFARGFIQTAEICRQDWKAMDCYIRAAMFAGAVTYNKIVPGKIENWLTKKSNWKLFKEGVFETDAVNFNFKRPVTKEGMEQAVEKLKKVKRWGGLAATLPTVAFNMESIIRSSLILQKCLKNATIGDCDEHIVRDAQVDIALSVVDVVATLLTIPFFKVGMAIDVCLLGVEMTYNVWTKIHALNKKGIYPNGEHVFNSIMTTVIPIWPASSELERLKLKSALLTSTRKSHSEVLQNYTNYKGVISSYHFKPSCILNLVQRDQYNASRAQGKTPTGFSSPCVVSVDNGYTLKCTHNFGLSFPFYCPLDVPDYAVLTHLCDGCTATVNNNFNITQTARYLVYLRGLKGGSYMTLPKAGNGDMVHFNVIFPKDEVTNVNIYFPDNSLIQTDLPHEKYHGGKFVIGNGSSLTVGWQDHLSFVKLRIEETNSRLTMTSVGEKVRVWLNESVQEKIFKINIYGTPKSREIISCTNLQDSTSQRIILQTEGSQNVSRPDEIANCQNVIISGNTRFHANGNKTFNLDLLPHFNKTEPDYIHVSIKQGFVILNARHLDLYQVSPNISMEPVTTFDWSNLWRILLYNDSQSFWSDTLIHNYNLKINYPHLSVSVDVRNNIGRNVPFIIRDSTSITSLVRHTDKVIKFTRFIPLIEDCPIDVENPVATVKVNVTKTWSDAILSTILEYRNCSVFIGSSFGDDIFPKNGSWFIYAASGNSSLHIPLQNATVFVKKFQGIQTNKLSMMSSANFSFLRMGSNLKCENIINNLTVEVEGYFQPEVYNTWIMHDETYLVPFVVWKFGNSYIPLPYFYYDDEGGNTFVFSNKSREQWKYIVIDLHKQDVLYGRVNKSIIITTKPANEKKLTVLLHDFYEWIPEPFFIIFALPFYNETRVLWPNSSIPLVDL